MKICYFITHFPYQNAVKNYKRGGAEYVAYNLAINMAKKCEVNVFTTSVDNKDSVEFDNRIKVYRYGTKFRIEHGSLAPKLFYEPLKYNFDIIHAHFSTPPAELAALRMARKKKVPFIITYHGDWQEGFGGFIRRTTIYLYNKFLIHKLLSYTDVIISPSEYYITESRFLSKYKDKIVVIPNGINLEDFQVPYSKEECRELLGLPVDRNIVLFVGNLIPYKGPDVLLKAIPYLIREVPDSLVVFVGSGMMKQKLEELTNKLGIRSHVRFEGFVEERLKPLYYKSADVFCLPSTMNTEVFPIVLLEASASGLPMVVSDLNTFKCIIENEYNGIFTERSNEVDLANALIYLLSDEKARKRMGKNAREKVENYYSWNNIAEVTKRLYEGLLNEDLPAWRI